MPLIFSAMVASTRCEASLRRRRPDPPASAIVADQRGSIVTRFTSYLQVICTFTIPAPDWPSNLERRELLLHAAHVLLHLLRLLHQLADVAFHFRVPRSLLRWWNRRPCRRTGRRGPATNPSARTARAASAPLRFALAALDGGRAGARSLGHRDFTVTPLRDAASSAAFSLFLVAAIGQIGLLLRHRELEGGCPRGDEARRFAPARAPRR